MIRFRLEKLIFYGIVLIVFLFILYPLIYSPTTKTTKKATELYLKNIYKIIESLEETNRATIGEQLRGINNGKNLYDKWERLLLQDAGMLKMEPDYILKYICSDAWGNKLNIDYKTNVILKGGNQMLTNIRFDIIIWSSGKNGINEYGNGDDITFISK